MKLIKFELKNEIKHILTGRSLFCDIIHTIGVKPKYTGYTLDDLFKQVYGDALNDMLGNYTISSGVNGTN